MGEKSQKVIQNSLVLVSLAGLAFSGYLSAVKLFSQTCAVDTSCSYFLGHPTCYYGFALFLALSVFALAQRFKRPGPNAKKILIAVSVLGIIFSGYFSFVEILSGIKYGFTGKLVLPSCFYGHIAYWIILGLTLKLRPSQVLQDKTNQEALTTTQAPNNNQNA